MLDGPHDDEQALDGPHDDEQALDGPHAHGRWANAGECDVAIEREQRALSFAPVSGIIFSLFVRWRDAWPWSMVFRAVTLIRWALLGTDAL